MSAEDIDSKPPEEDAGSKSADGAKADAPSESLSDDDRPQISPEELAKKLEEMLQTAEIAVSVAEGAVREVEEMAKDPSLDQEHIDQARQSTADALERAQIAYQTAQEQAGHAQGKPVKKRLEGAELDKAVSDIVDGLKRKLHLNSVELDRELAERARQARLAQEKIDNRKVREELAEKARQKELEKEKAAEAEKQKIEAERAEVERRRELNKTPEGRAQLAKEAKDRRITVNAIKREALEKVMYGLKPRYSKLRGSLTTMFMLPSVRPLYIEQASKEHEPRLICNFGLLKKTPNGHRTNKFRSVVRSGPKGIKFQVDHQAWRSYLDGSADVGPTRYDWGTDMHGMHPNPIDNLTAKEAITEMHKRLDLVEKEHESMLGGRLLKAGALVGVIVAGIAYSEHSKADPINGQDLESDQSNMLVVDDAALSKLPGHIMYDADANVLALDEQSDEPSF